MTESVQPRMRFRGVVQIDSSTTPAEYLKLLVIQLSANKIFPYWSKNKQPHADFMDDYPLVFTNDWYAIKDDFIIFDTLLHVKTVEDINTFFVYLAHPSITLLFLEAYNGELLVYQSLGKAPIVLHIHEVLSNLKIIDEIYGNIAFLLYENLFPVEYQAYMKGANPDG